MRKEKQLRTALNLLMAVVLGAAAPVLVSGQEPEPKERPGASGGCSDLSGTWEIEPGLFFVSREGQMRPNLAGVFTWEFTKYTKKGPLRAMTREERVLEGKGDAYRVREATPSDRFNSLYAKLLEGNLLHLWFETLASGEGYRGDYECKLDENCQASVPPCKLVFTTDSIDGRREFIVDAVIKRRQKE